MQIPLSRTLAGPVGTVKQEQEEISPNHVQAFSGGSVILLVVKCSSPAFGGVKGCYSACGKAAFVLWSILHDNRRARAT